MRGCHRISHSRRVSLRAPCTPWAACVYYLWLRWCQVFSSLLLKFVCFLACTCTRWVSARALSKSCLSRPHLVYISSDGPTPKWRRHTLTGWDRYHRHNLLLGDASCWALLWRFFEDGEVWNVCLRSRIFLYFYFLSQVVCNYIKGMAESFLLSKDEPLTPNIDKVTRVWLAQNTKNRQKLDLFDSGFIFYWMNEGGNQFGPFVLEWRKSPR